MIYHYHDESIVKNLAEDTLFVFGSNLAGTHAGGAAKIAHLHFGASKGVGRGWAGQSFAIPTMNEHLQQMPLSQIQHYIDDFKIYVKHHPKLKFFITAVGCGVAGYKVEEIAPMFKGIGQSVIFPESFRPFVEKTLPKINSAFLHTFFDPAIIFAEDAHSQITALPISDAEKSLANILINTPMSPEDSNGRERDFEIKDILYLLDSKIDNFKDRHQNVMYFGGVILALLELYHLNEQDFVDAWLGKRDLARPSAANVARR